jgi:hypothetical protein
VDLHGFFEGVDKKVCPEVHNHSPKAKLIPAQGMDEINSLGS